MTSNQTWSDLGIEADICEVLTKRGITSPFPIQTLTIPDALSGKDVCGKAKTGSGKTLAFGIPMIQNLNLDIKASTASLRVLILVPTRELAVQVQQEFKSMTKGLNLFSACFQTTEFVPSIISLDTSSPLLAGRQ